MSGSPSGSGVGYAFYADYVYDVCAMDDFKLECAAVNHYTGPLFKFLRQITWHQNYDLLFKSQALFYRKCNIKGKPDVWCYSLSDKGLA
jgi:hypothetical protein